MFYSPNGVLDNEAVSQKSNFLAILDMNAATENGDFYCTDRDTNSFYLYLTSSNNSE